MRNWRFIEDNDIKIYIIHTIDFLVSPRHQIDQATTETLDPTSINNIYSRQHQHTY